MRLGLIARADNSGLGMLSWEFYENFREHITKVVIVDNGAYKPFPERFDDAPVVKPDLLKGWILEGFLNGIDILLAIETPYDWNVFRVAKSKGIKTVLIPMFECNDKPLEVYPDLIACPSKIDYESFKGEPSKLQIIPLPVNRKRLPFKKRKRANVFLHDTGHGGIGGRTGTMSLINALPLVKERNVIFVIQSQIPLPDIKDSRVEVRVGNVKNYWDLYRDGDVFILPEKFEMISMPVQEALSVGMPVLHPRFSLYEKFPKSWFIPHEKIIDTKLFARPLRMFEIAAQSIADKINEWVNKDISQDSEIANQLAEEISWEKLKPQWIKLFQSL